MKNKDLKINLEGKRGKTQIKFFNNVLVVTRQDISRVKCIKVQQRASAKVASQVRRQFFCVFQNTVM